MEGAALKMIEVLFGDTLMIPVSSFEDENEVHGNWSTSVKLMKGLIRRKVKRRIRVKSYIHGTIWRRTS
jgi:hypothetical protein